MIVAYIITEQRKMVVKLITQDDAKVFSWKGFEYNVRAEKMYQKKFFGFKTFFFSMYIQGNPEPVSFDSAGRIDLVQDVPINELAILMRKIRKGMLDEIAMYVGFGTFGICLGILIVVVQIAQNMGVF